MHEEPDSAGVKVGKRHCTSTEPPREKPKREKKDLFYLVNTDDKRKRDNEETDINRKSAGDRTDEEIDPEVKPLKWRKTEVLSAKV